MASQGSAPGKLESRAAIKYPAPVAFVRQANISAGLQQINNGVPAPTRAEETDNAPSKLEGPNYDERMDARAPGMVRGADPAAAAVGAIDGTEVRRG